MPLFAWMLPECFPQLFGAAQKTRQMCQTVLPRCNSCIFHTAPSTAVHTAAYTRRAAQACCVPYPRQACSA
eukprot:366081-Chlamydomonas_euryale.AAC.6